ncbi:Uma2 family endonuclease [Thermoleptolyngbya sichuanensis A183]|uniref:Uma2 family endonuclease n=1 Tax=Thermoleptolyngbya sichuanensis A183 TaxID=2737172 RepID=A0A6M8B4D6_9CYAN|nr:MULTISPECIES: Uma2 family endonuclease [Thermoleptolyngbya]QKD82079.1 Uma2 family endonuclease [Thermoleptolyngbya sichuanensis A183]
MTTLRIHAELTPLTVELPAQMSLGLEQFHELCRANPDLRIERSATGVVMIMPPTFSDSGNRNFNLTVQLGLWAEEDATGIGFDSSTGFTLPNGAIRSPDAAWIRLERWNALRDEQQASFAPICPDFVVELRSASDRLNLLQDKMQEYLDNGASLGWLIDRPGRTVYVYQRDRPVQVLENPETLRGDPVLPGFALRLEKIW